MIPVVGLAATQLPAAAVTEYGDSIQTTWYVEGTWRPADDGDCTYRAQWSVQDGGAAGVNASINCDTQWNIQFDRVTVRHSGSDAANKGCESEIIIDEPEVDSPPSSGYSSIVGTEPGADPNTCHLTEICWTVWTWDIPQSNSEGVWAEGCDDMDLGPMEDEPTNCGVQSTVAQPILGTAYRLNASGRSQWVLPVTIPVTSHTAPTPNSVYGTYGIVQGSSTGYTSWDYLPSSLSAPTGTGYPGNIPKTSAGGNRTLVAPGSWFVSQRTITPVVGAVQNIEIQVAVSPRWNPSTEGANLYTGPTHTIRGVGIVLKMSGTYSGAMNFNPESVTGQWGLTTANEAFCSFYWGDPVVAIAGTDADVPVGGLNPDTGTPNPDPDPPSVDPENPGEDQGCSFSFTDPSTWASAGICALVALMGKLLNAVGAVIDLLGGILAFLGGLVTSLLSGLGALLTALFLPSDGLFEQQFDAVKGDLEGSNFDQWTDLVGASSDVPTGGAGFAGAAPTGQSEGGSIFGGLVNTGSGCAGPEVQWDLLAEAGLPTTIKPVEACSGAVATVAQLCRVMLTVLIGVAAVSKCVGLLATSLGASKQIHALGSFDWSAREYRA